MNLKTNKEHKKINSTNLKNKMKSITTSTIGGILTITLLSGCTVHTSKNYIQLETENYIIDNFSISNKNKKQVHIISSEETLNKTIEEIKQYPQITELTLKNTYVTTEIFNETNFGFLRNYNIKKLELNNVTINPSFLESINSIEELTIKNDDLFKVYIDYSKLKNLKKITFKKLGLYDYPIFLTNELINNLLSKGVEIELDNVDIEQVIEINNSIDNVVKQLNVTKESSESEKLKAILIYILDNFYYDEQIFYDNSIGVTNVNYIKTFYKNGELDAIFNKEGNIICGNYSALFQALANRLELKSYYIEGPGHAWNMVCFEGDKYYVDSTFLDETIVYNGNIKIEEATAQDLIKAGMGNNLEWYLKRIYEVGDDPNHQAYYIPSNNYEYVEYINEEVNLESDTKKLEEKFYKITIENEEFIVNMGTLLGLLITLGIAIKVTKSVTNIDKKKNKSK